MCETKSDEYRVTKMCRTPRKRENGVVSILFYRVRIRWATHIDDNIVETRERESRMLCLTVEGRCPKAPKMEMFERSFDKGASILTCQSSHHGELGGMFNSFHSRLKPKIELCSWKYSFYTGIEHARAFSVFVYYLSPWSFYFFGRRLCFLRGDAWNDSTRQPFSLRFPFRVALLFIPDMPSTE